MWSEEENEKILTFCEDSLYFDDLSLLMAKSLTSCHQQFKRLQLKEKNDRGVNLLSDCRLEFVSSEVKKIKLC